MHLSQHPTSFSDETEMTSKHRTGAAQESASGRLKYLVGAGLVAVLFLIGGMRPTAQASVTPLYGVTVDNPWNTDATVAALVGFARRVTARIVFDEHESARNFDGVVQALAQAADLMGEILDSQYVSRLSVAQFQLRVDSYLNLWGRAIKVWEICNECNGEWLGRNGDVVAKMTYAYDAAKARHFITALTLYYNQDCWSNPANEMFRWASTNVPSRMKDGLDYVLISYYEDDCNGLRPDWQSVFNRLGAMFPNSQIGFGEVGTDGNETPAQKAEYIRRYYQLQIDNPHYVGGYFYWWFSEDMVPLTSYLWGVLNSSWWP
jgi:hypothetical protein